MKTQRILISFENPILNKNDKVKLNTPVLNTLFKDFNSNKDNSVKPLNYNTIIGGTIKGLEQYNKNINEYILKWNSKTLINTLKNKSNTLNVNTLNNLDKDMLNISSKPLNENKVTKTFVYDYLKSISIFNSPQSQRGGNLFTSQEQIGYNFNYINYFKPEKLYKLIFSSFISMNSVISEPVYQETPNEMIIYINIFLFKSNTRNTNKLQTNNLNERFLEINQNKLRILCKILSRYFKKPVNLQIVKVHYSYFDSNIFVNLLQKVINKISLRNLMIKFFKKAIIKNPSRLRKNSLSNIPSVLTGIKIRVAGRLLTHRVVPRQTIKNVRRGALARGKINLLSTSRITSKNKRGAYSITVSTGQNIN